MIRIRNPKGEITEVPDACFVELADEEGNIAEVIFQGNNCELKRISHNSGETATNYSKVFGVDFIKKVIRL